MERPLHAAAFLGAAAHNIFELGCGVGLMFQPELGLGRASAMWAAVLPAGLAGASRGGGRWQAPLAAALGMNLGAVAIHYTLWPWRVRHRVPVLTAAEGLGADRLPAYNAILLAWSAAALLALATEVPRGTRRWAAAGFLAALPLRRHARHHFAWVRDQAAVNPAWWNRGVHAGDGSRAKNLSHYEALFVWACPRWAHGETVARPRTGRQEPLPARGRRPEDAVRDEPAGGEEECRRARATGASFPDDGDDGGSLR